MVLPTYKMGENFGTGTTKTTNEQPIKMAITCLNASIHQISKRMYTLLNDALNDAMYDITNQEPLPLLDEFEISENKRYIRVTCVNLYSAKWLIDEVKKLSPFRGKFLHVTTEGTVPKLRLFYVSFPNFSIDTKCDILRRIKQTTPSINTTFWKIRKTHTFWDKGLAAKLELDAPSIRLLEEMKYEFQKTREGKPALVLPTCKMNEEVGTEITENNDEPNLNMAIVCLDAMTLEILNKIYIGLKEAINEAMYSIKYGPVPLFDKFELSKDKGYIQVTCVNLYSKEWLIDAVEQLSPINRKSFYVTAEETVLKLRLFYVYLPELCIKKGTDILTRINRTAPQIDTDFWKIQKTETRLLNNGLVAKLELDERSIRLIEEMNYEVHVGMGKAYFWDRENKKGHPQAAFFLQYHWEKKSVGFN